LLRKGLARKALGARPLFLSALAKEVADAGRPKEALKHIRQAAALEPDNPQHFLRLGSILSMLGRFKDAITPLQKAAELAPNEPTTRRVLAGSLLRAGRG